MKITFMGAGSTVFARNVLGDCMCTPALCEAESPTLRSRKNTVCVRPSQILWESAVSCVHFVPSR